MCSKIISTCCLNPTGWLCWPGGALFDKPREFLPRLGHCLPRLRRRRARSRNSRSWQAPARPRARRADQTWCHSIRRSAVAKVCPCKARPLPELTAWPDLGETYTRASVRPVAAHLDRSRPKPSSSSKVSSKRVMDAGKVALPASARQALKAANSLGCGSRSGSTWSSATMALTPASRDLVVEDARGDRLGKLDGVDAELIVRRARP